MRYALVLIPIFFLIACNNPPGTTLQPIATSAKTATNIVIGATLATVFPTNTLPKHTPTSTSTPTPTSIPTPTGGSQHIAYFSGCNGCKSYTLSIVDSDGKVNILINPSGKRRGWKKQFSWSPDGEHLAFIDDYYYGGGGELYIADADGNNIQKIDNLRSSSYSWSPDSEQLVYVRVNEDGMPNVFKKDIYGDEFSQLTDNTDPTLIFKYPEWSPEGNNIAFVGYYHPNNNSDKDISEITYIVDLDGTIIFQFASNGVIEDIIWSPNGKKVFLTKKNLVYEEGNYRYENHEIIAVDINTNRVDTITTFLNTDIYRILPKLSPDGTLIAYVSTIDGQKELFIIDTNGNNPRNVTNHTGNDNCPIWSPDGTQLLFRSERNNKNSIYKINMSDLKVQYLTNSGADDGVSCPLSWSPDGTQIVFGQVYVMNSDGRNVRRILDNDYARIISWQPSP